MPRPACLTRRRVRATHVVAQLALLVSVGTAAPREAAAQTSPAPHTTLSSMEQHYQRLRYWDDQRRLMSVLGQDTTPAGMASASVADSLQAEQRQLRTDLAMAPTPPSGSADAVALAAIREAWITGLDQAGSTDGHPDSARRLCSDPTVDPSPVGDRLRRLTEQVLSCYADAANQIVVGGDTLNRLGVLGTLAHEESSIRRHQLFLALAPVWRSVNGDNRTGSPYRTLLKLRRDAWGRSTSPIAAKAPAFGLTTLAMEAWLLRALTAWRDATPDSLLEPWDWYYSVGEASRHFGSRLPDVSDIRQVNDAYYRSLGADPVRLRVGYDLLARPGKYPVAFTDIGARGQWTDSSFTPNQPWVFTAYLTGGFDNLSELLHETGHAIHIAGIRTRPALLDWPDNDTFTEALADVPALELFEPAWQQRFLGDSITTHASLRAKYAGIVFDMAWALFELRVHSRPGVDPNAVWTNITRDYLHIRPHPEWSWWAMRGQLVDAPGYLINYALGAFIAADIRARVLARRGPFSAADSTLYPWLSTEIYRFGRERTSRAVLESFLGRSLRPEALLADLSRMGK